MSVLFCLLKTKMEIKRTMLSWPRLSQQAQGGTCGTLTASYFNTIHRSAPSKRIAACFETAHSLHSTRAAPKANDTFPCFADQPQRFQIKKNS